MKFYQLDPIQDPRWAELVNRHAGASVFHSVPWLTALQLTYGYELTACTTSAPTRELSNGLVFCHVRSWLTGHRMVSLPFSDHCEPLFDSAEDVDFLIRYLQSSLERKQCEYLEVRPIKLNFGRTDNDIGFVPSATYFINAVDLRSDLDDVFGNLDRDAVQVPFERAKKAGLVEKCGTSDELLSVFYRLLVETRNEYQLPPPFVWFRNLVHCHGGALEIRVAYQGQTPIAAILTLRFRDAVYCRYECSDKRFNQIGAIPWLLHRSIAAAKSSGAYQFDMGRSVGNDEETLGKKSNRVAEPQRLVYWRYPDNSRPLASGDGWKLKAAKRSFARIPSALLAITGKLLYRHIG